MDREQEQQRKVDEKGHRPIPPALRKLLISGNILPILASRTRSRKVYMGVDGEALHSFLPTIDEAIEEDDGDDVLACDNGGAIVMQVTLDLPEPTKGYMPPEPKNRQQAMKMTEWSAWREAKETEMRGMIENSVYEQVARP